MACGLVLVPESRALQCEVPIVVAILLKERRDLLQWKIEHPDAVNV